MYLMYFSFTLIFVITPPKINTAIIRRFRALPLSSARWLCSWCVATDAESGIPSLAARTALTSVRRTVQSETHEAECTRLWRSEAASQCVCLFKRFSREWRWRLFNLKRSYQVVIYQVFFSWSYPLIKVEKPDFKEFSLQVSFFSSYEMFIMRS